MMVSSMLSRASAALFAGIGLALLFASDELLPRVIAGYPAGAAWLGELVAAGWLGMAFLNWANREALLGGIYARPVVAANQMFCLVSAATLIRTTRAGAGAPFLVALAVVMAGFAIMYTWLLFRGPLAGDFERFRGGTAAPPGSPNN